LPSLVADSLRKQARECLEAAKRTSDVAVREELLAASAWLHEEALKLEGLLERGGGGGTPKRIERLPDGSYRFTPPKLKAISSRFLSA
jgi:hypothetical protein